MVNFITLTLSATQQHSDKFILHRMLRPFLKWMMRKGATRYVWKAEVQDNGNIHFHITTNFYLHWRGVRNKWNNLQQRYGYTKRFMDVHGHNDPNSTDIHSIKDPMRCTTYMVKYMLKADRYKKNQSETIAAAGHHYENKLNERDKAGKWLKRSVECAIWNCSNTLSKYKINVTEEEAGFEKVMSYVAENSDRSTVNKGTLYLYKDKNIFHEVMRMIQYPGSVGEGTTQ